MKVYVRSDAGNGVVCVDAGLSLGGMLSSLQGKVRGVIVDEDLAVCNEATRKVDLRLTEEQMAGLVERRGDALRETGRVEFGRGIVREVILGFCDSPFIVQENYEETIADVQDIFYRRKEEAEISGAFADEDLIQALRFAFDKRGGSIDALADVTVAELYGYAERYRSGEYDELTQNEGYERECASDGPEEYVHDELSRIQDDERGSRPDNDFAIGYYDACDELYRTGNDFRGRIGGSSLG